MNSVMLLQIDNETELVLLSSVLIFSEHNQLEARFFDEPFFKFVDNLTVLI